jgi:hypothetical protein
VSGEHDQALAAATELVVNVGFGPNRDDCGHWSWRVGGRRHSL